MEAKKLDATLRVDAEGRLQGDAELLARMANQTFTVQVVGTTITLEPKRLHEIEDLEERRRAYQEFKRQVTRPGGSSLPADWATIRDSIYD